MSWVKTLSISIATAGAVFAAANPQPARADVVVASSGPSAAQFPAGKKLSAAETITLKAGDSVTVLSSNGTRIITGAGSHRVGARGAAKRSTFATLTRQRAASRVRTGAVRGDTGAEAIVRPNIWYVDVSQSGSMCLGPDMAVQLWRPETAGAPTYMVASSASPNHMHLAFADGATTTDWDLAQMPVSDGANYTITGPGGPASEVRVAILAAQPENAEDLAEALIAKGCTGQLELLATAMM